MATIHKIGRRKASVARVYLSEGKGEFTVNKRPVNEYFNTDLLRYKMTQAFNLTGTTGTFDVKASVLGGGITGQAEAIRLGIARALCEVNPEYRAMMKPYGLLTRDPRVVERKKFGQKKARKRYQFSKR